MSPSEAIKTSSPCDKNTLFVSPGRLAKPKNFSVMGGGGGIVGSGRMPAASLALSLSVAPVPLGFSITATDPTTKIFLPLPAYLIPSLWLSRLRSSVGSNRSSATGTIFPEAVRLVRGFAAAEVGCAATGAASGDDGQNS